MENFNVATVVFVIIVGIALIIFINVRNNKDKKEIDPSSQDAVTEEKTEELNDRERE